MVERNSNKQTLVTFELAGQQYAMAASCVDRIIAMAEVERLPSAPKLLFGFLNLAGTPIPVIRLHRLFQLPEPELGLWTPLIVVRCSKPRLALLVDKVTQVLTVDDEAVLPLPAGHALNDCVEGIVRPAGDSVLLLSPERLLLQKEGQAVAELQQLAEQRLRDLQVVNA